MRYYSKLLDPACEDGVRLTSGTDKNIVKKKGGSR
tara:strand:- start:92 stop:196 length:105 start_codon:yes stop_codon:yes gene_type:complete